MFFQHIYDRTLSQSSYLIGCQETGEAMVIDAKRDTDTYLEIARQHNLRITHIVETHIHADFLCGSRELAFATGAKMYLSDEGGADWQYDFPHEGVREGSVIAVGNLSFSVLHTPGHTPESISFLLTDHPSSEEPVMLFSGDFVFVGDVGRPDLLEEAAGIKGTKEEGARQMFASLKKFKELPDYVQVWPAHGAGSACGKALGAVPSSTVGYEKHRNWALQFKNNQEKEFVQALLNGQPEPPKYFAMMKKLNKINRPLKVEVPCYPRLTKAQFVAAYQKGIKIIDTRSRAEFAEGYLAQSLNIPNNNSFATWMGWIVNFEEPFILLAPEDQIEILSRKLMRIGLDNLMGYYSDFQEICTDLDWNMGDVINLEQFKTCVGNPDIQILDVRNRSEYQKGHVKGAKNAFVGTLQDHLLQLDKNKEVVVYCQSGDRASVAYSVLKKNGFTEVKNYSGGMKEWKEKTAAKHLSEQLTEA